jgi:hypothetical protein
MTTDQKACDVCTEKGKNPRRSRLQGSMGESYMSNHSSKVFHYKVQSQQLDSKNIQE